MEKGVIRKASLNVRALNFFIEFLIQQSSSYGSKKRTDFEIITKEVKCLFDVTTPNRMPWSYNMLKTLLAPLSVGAEKEKANISFLHFKTPLSIKKLTFSLGILEVPTLKRARKKQKWRCRQMVWVQILPTGKWRTLHLNKILQSFWSR